MQIKTIQCYELNFLHKSQDADGITVSTDISSLGSSGGRGETAPLSVFLAVLPKSLSLKCSNKPSGWGTHVYLWRIHIDIWQNQYNIVKLKNEI